MNQYYLHKGNQQSGPFTIEQLKAIGITKETPVWKDGMTSWIKAGDLPELRDALMNVPPPFTSVQDSVSNQSQIKTRWPMYLIFVAIIVAIGFIYWVNQGNKTNTTTQGLDDYPESTNSKKTEEEIKDDLGVKERLDPAKYFYVDNGRSKMNLLDETVMEGTIICNAKVAKFKDPVLEAQFYSASKTLLGVKRFTSYEIFTDGSQVPFKFKTIAPKATKSINFQVIDAVVVH